MNYVGPIVAAVATLTPVATLALVCPDASASQVKKVQQKSTKKPVETTTFTSAVVPFLKKHCIPCHGPTASKGGITLHDISRNLAIGKDMDLWNLVLKQLVLSEMPPSTEKQPLVSDVSKVIDWINTELNMSGNAASLYQKLEHPDYGNLVSHEKLFSGEIKTKPFSPARLWRTSPNVFDNIKSSYGGDARSIRQPFLVEDRKGIKEYANLLFADSAVVDVLLANAGYCADQLIQKERIYRDIAAQQNAPNQDQLEVAALQHFKKVVFRDPTKDELIKYSDLFKSSAKEGDNAEALRVMLMAIMLHPESVYRIEIGLGELDASGRRMLSPTELAFALSYALTDQRPDSILLQAAESGKLKTKEDVRAQISRMLEDESLEKPRILRFFQEFFGYNQAHIVFKDEARSGGFRYYGEDYPVIYERDADFFVLNILTKDKDVFRKLLTSDEYFILNRQTFRNTVYAFYEQNKAMIDKGQLSEEKSKELLKSLGLKDWKELNTKYYLHPFDRGFSGSPTAIKNMGKEIPTEGRIGHPDEGKTFQAVSQGMHIIYEKYPMAYDLKDDEQNFLLPQPYKRPNRAGMLTHPAWLISHSLNDISDPIRRGKWIRQRLLVKRHES